MNKIPSGILVDKLLIKKELTINYISILMPLLGVFLGVFNYESFPITKTTAFIFFIFLLPNIIGLTLGLHRYFTHCAFIASNKIRFVIGIFSTWCYQGPVTRWVADHRRHHQFSDQAWDVHSPYYNCDEKINNKFIGIWNAHMGWMLNLKTVTDTNKYAKDCVNDPVCQFLTKHYLLIAFTGLFFPALFGWLLSDFNEAITCFLWAGCFRVALLHQITWSVNSFGHMFGRHYEGCRCNARDNLLLTWLTFGEGLHSYHHANPIAIINKPEYSDLIGQLIKLAVKVRMFKLRSTHKGNRKDSFVNE